MKAFTFDIETYINYTLFAFKNTSTKKLITFEIKGELETLTEKSIKKMKKLLTKNTIITYNGLKFDEPCTAYAMSGKNAQQIFKLVQQLIIDKQSVWQFYRQARLEPMITHHIDIMDVARGSASLKLYGARLGTKKLQDLPYEPQTSLSKKEMKDVLHYCDNDNIVTNELYDYLESDLDLRRSMGEEYGMNFMSFKGAKIAEMILVHECGYTGKGVSIPKQVKYTPPKYVKFKTPELQAMFEKMSTHKFLVMKDDVLKNMKPLQKEYTFLLDDLGIEKSTKVRHGSKSKKTVSNSGNVINPDFVDAPIEFDGIQYKFGLGGLHASVSSTTIIPKDDEVIVDIDYRSLYPDIIIQNDYSPSQIGSKFSAVFRRMFNKRNFELKPAMKKVTYGSEEYKTLDRQQNTMKLVLNSSFGQTGQRFSKIYDPNVMLHTTLTGQLTLMMVVEKLSLKGFKTFYANTDGITLLIKKKDLNKVKKITEKFDKKTGLTMEYNYFSSSHIRDVNNFVNITDDFKVKSKGAFAERDLEKNSNVPIVFEAVRKFLQDKTPIEISIRSCKDVNLFCTSRQVTGGATFGKDIPEMYPDDWEEKLNSKRGLTKDIVKRRDKMEANWVKDNGDYLGKVVRWYYSTNGSSIHYKKSGNKVPMSEGAYPMMDLPKKNKLPDDIDYEWYFQYAQRMLGDLGYV